MTEIKKNDIVFNTKTKKEYKVDCVETHGDFTVVFTEENKCKCFLIEDTIKLGKSKLANFFLKKFYGASLTNEEENYIDLKLNEIKPIQISPFNPDFFMSIDLPDL